VKRLIAVVMLIALAVPAESQIRRRVPRAVEPSVWVSGGIGLFNANGVNDGDTESTWDFGESSNAQYRLAVEKAFRNTASIGVTGTYVRVPFTYRGPSAPGSCGQCAAHLDAVSLGASFHVGGGIGLHQVLEGSAGVIQYRNLTQDSDGSRLAPENGNIDPYFTFGYGFGYAFGRTMQVSVVQDFGLALHERRGLTSEQSNTLRQRTIRLNFRYGMGSRARN